MASGLASRGTPRRAYRSSLGRRRTGWHDARHRSGRAGRRLAMLGAGGRRPGASRGGDRRELHQEGPGGGRGARRPPSGRRGPPLGSGDPGQDRQGPVQRRCRGREAAGAAKRGVTTVIEKIDPGTLAELVDQGDRPPGDDQRVAPPEGLALPDLGDLDLGVDPAGGHASRSSGSTTSRGGRRRPSCPPASSSSRSSRAATSCSRSTGRRSMRRAVEPTSGGRHRRARCPRARSRATRSRSPAAPRPPRSGGSSVRRSRAR